MYGEYLTVIRGGGGVNVNIRGRGLNVMRPSRPCKARAANLTRIQNWSLAQFPALTVVFQICDTWAQSYCQYRRNRWRELPLFP